MLSTGVAKQLESESSAADGHVRHPLLRKTIMKLEANLETQSQEVEREIPGDVI